MKKTIKSKLLIIILIIFSLFTILNTHTYALGSIITSGEKFENARANYTVNGTHNDMEIDSKDLQDVSNMVYNVLLLLGIVIAILIGIVLGIKFMTGSIEEQAKVKESLVPYIAGCVVIFGAFTIWKVVLEVLKTTA